MDALPEWEPGSVAVLSTGAGRPHAIPVSTAVRAGPRTVLLALALTRESLARLLADPRVALTLLDRDVACTAHGSAHVVQEPMEADPNVAAIRIDVDELQDHRRPTFALHAGVAWDWTDDGARERDRVIRDALRSLASGPA